MMTLVLPGGEMSGINSHLAPRDNMLWYSLLNTLAVGGWDVIYMDGSSEEVPLLGKIVTELIYQFRFTTNV